MILVPYFASDKSCVTIIIVIPSLFRRDKISITILELSLSRFKKDKLWRTTHWFFEKLLELYFYQATCVCFLGEGENTLQKSQRANNICKNRLQKMGKKVCLYSGRDVEPENWMNVFDYIKVGSYQQFLGSLDSSSTNQAFYRKKADGIYENITYTFWL